MECSVPECEKPRFCKGYCQLHYARWRKHGDPLHVGKPGPPRRICTIPGCENGQVGQGLCDKHYRRWRKHGDPLVLQRVRGQGDEARWWFHVDKRGDDECWPWTGHIDKHGYGRFWTGTSVGYAARWGYERFVSPMPGEHMPDHTCHDPEFCTVPHTECPHRACVNYHHLEPVTNRENCLRGGRTKLSDESVAVLYATWKGGAASVEGLALAVGVHKTTLYRRFRRLENAPPG